MPYTPPDPVTLLPRSLMEQLQSLKAGLKEETGKVVALEQEVALLRRALEEALKPLPVENLIQRYGDTTRWLVIGRQRTAVVGAEMHKPSPYPQSVQYIPAARSRLREDGAYYTQTFLGIRCVYDPETGLYAPRSLAPDRTFTTDDEE